MPSKIPSRPLSLRSRGQNDPQDQDEGEAAMASCPSEERRADADRADHDSGQRWTDHLRHVLTRAHQTERRW